MTSPQARESRPAGNWTADVLGGDLNGSSIPRATHTAHDDVPQGHALVLTVAGRRRVVLSTAAADRAIRRAHDRGDHASVELVRLVPVRSGDEHVPGRHEVRRDASGALVPNTYGGAA